MLNQHVNQTTHQHINSLPIFGAKFMAHLKIMAETTGANMMVTVHIIILFFVSHIKYIQSHLLKKHPTMIFNPRI